MVEPWTDDGSRPKVDRRSGSREDPEWKRYLDGIYSLARSNGLLDEVTGDHVFRIRKLVEHIALQMGCDAKAAERMGYDAMLHDVGKLTIPPSVLGKPGELTAEEREVMQSHTVRGARMLSGSGRFTQAARIARNHHEAWDGSGYPEGLAGEAIPREARITAAADVLDALMSSRPYKAGWSYEEAIDEMRRLSGTQLDPEVAAALERCHEAGVLRGIFIAGEAGAGAPTSRREAS